MQAIQLTKYGEPEESLRLAEILIRVEYAPINDNDMLLARGLYTIQPKLPSVVGNEGAGKVLAVGDGVHNVKIGDRVVIPLGVFSWAEKVLAPAEKAIVLPAEIDPRQAAMLSINPPAAALLLEEFVSLKRGDWIVQNASNSGVGRSVIAFAKQKGVRTINIVRRPELIQELKDIGADVVLLAGRDGNTIGHRRLGSKNRLLCVSDARPHQVEPVWPGCQARFHPPVFHALPGQLAQNSGEDSCRSGVGRQPSASLTDRRGLSGATLPGSSSSCSGRRWQSSARFHG